MAEPTIRFLGQGTDHHHQLPARDLTGEEYQALDTPLRAIVRDSPLYDYAGYREKQRRANPPRPRHTPPAADGTGDDAAQPETPPADSGTGARGGA
jgi:hypothetical protein